jgi:hypothetical protein
MMAESTYPVGRGPCLVVTPGERLGADDLEEPHDRGARVRAERTGGALSPTVCGEGVERLLEPGRLRLGDGERVLLRVDRAVEDERPHLARVEVGVGGAEEGAVGVAQVGEAFVADGASDRLEVPYRLIGAEGGERLAISPAAPCGDGPVLLHGLREGGLAHGVRV